MRTKLITAGCFLGLALSAGATTTHYVSTNGFHIHPFTSMANAATNLADAVAAAPSGGTVIVDRGHYYATESIGKPDWTSLTVTSLYGAAETIYDGGGQAMDGFKFTGSLSVYGMTFTNFYSPDNDAAALYLNHAVASLFLDACVFSGNTGLEAGAVRVRFGSVEAKDVLFKGNTATTTGNYGGGAIRAGNLVLDGCEFVGNKLPSGSQGGGAIYTSGTSVIRNSFFSGNTASGNSAGAVYAMTWADIMIKNSFFVDNTNSAVRLRAAAGAGQIINAHVRNCLIANNDGWGIDAGHRYNFMVLENNTIANNTGGITANSGADEGTITNINTIVYYNDNNHSVADNVFWVNSCTTPEPAHNWSPENGVTADPDLDAEFKPRGGSPVINAGLNQDWMLDAVDLAGNPRILHDTVDMGAYELFVPMSTLFMVR